MPKLNFKKKTFKQLKAMAFDANGSTPLYDKFFYESHPPEESGLYNLFKEIDAKDKTSSWNKYKISNDAVMCDNLRELLGDNPPTEVNQGEPEFDEPQYSGRNFADDADFNVEINSTTTTTYRAKHKADGSLGK